MGHRVSWRAGTTKKPGDAPAPQGALSFAGEQALQDDEEQQQQSQKAKSNDARENQNTGTANVYLPIYLHTRGSSLLKINQLHLFKCYYEYALPVC